MNRTASYNQELGKRLRDPRYAQQFILGLMEGDEGLSSEEAVKTVIKIMGVKEFGAMVEMASANVSAFLRGRRRLKRETLDLLLAPFRLKTKLVLVRA